MVRNDRKCEDNFMFPQMISACKGFLKSNKFTIAIHMLSLTNSWLRGENHSQHIFFEYAIHVSYHVNIPTFIKDKLDCI